MRSGVRVVGVSALLALSAWCVGPAAGRSIAAAPQDRAAASQIRLDAGERAALEGLAARTRGEVATLSARARALPDGPARRELLLRIVSVKQEAEVARLRALSRFASRHGDLELAAQIQQAIERWLDPRPASRPPGPELPGSLRKDSRLGDKPAGPRPAPQ